MFLKEDCEFAIIVFLLALVIKQLCIYIINKSQLVRSIAEYGNFEVRNYKMVAYADTSMPRVDGYLKFSAFLKVESMHEFEVD